MSEAQAGDHSPRKSPRSPQAKAKPGGVAVRFLGILAASLTNVGASMGISLNPVQNPLPSADASTEAHVQAGGDSSLVTKTFEPEDD